MKASLLLVAISVGLASPCAFAAKESTKPAPKAEKPKAPAAAGYTVKAGDNFAKIARALGTTSDSLAKANGLSSDAIIRPGQTLKIPAKTVAKAAPPAKSQTDPIAKNTANTHQVQAGETFYSISKKRGISAAALAAANPTAVPTALKLGQLLNLSVATAPKSEKAEPDAAATTPPPTEPVALTKKIAVHETPKTTLPSEESPPAKLPVAKPPAPTAPSAAPPETKTVVEARKPPSPEPSTPTAPPATAGPKFINATVDHEITLGDFAAKHGADAKRLNELNGLDLTAETVLAKGSELIVPVQP
jgi:LysM repeat protein